MATEHLYIGACVQQRNSGSWQAHCPDLPGCVADGASEGEALARIRLAIEVRVAELLGQGEELPKPRDLDTLRDAAPDAGEYFSVHINLRHLSALARHQSGRWGKD